MGNRLLGMASAYAAAQKLNRELVIVWKRETGCNIRADELFDLPMQVVEISENGYKKEPVARILGEREKKKWRAKASRFLSCDDVERITREEGYDALLDLIAKEPCIYIKIGRAHV